MFILFSLGYNFAMKNIFKKKKKQDDERVNDIAIMREQTLRIQELKRENADLINKLEDYRKKEESIISTINFAQNEADKLIRDSRQRYALECERLKKFREKWVGYVSISKKTGKLAEDFEESNRVLKECQAELEEMIYKDLMEGSSIDDVKKSYFEERERTDGEPTLNYKEIIKEESIAKDLQDSEKEEPITIELNRDEEKEKMSESELRALIKQIDASNQKKEVS